MKHIAPERLVELSLVDAAGADEQAHLACCACCADELAAERALTAALATLPQPAPPPSFVSETCAACERALATRQRRFTAVTLLGALVLGNLAALFGIALVVVNAGPIAHGAALTLNQLVIAAQAVHAAATALPSVAWATLVFTCAAGLGLSAFVGRLAFVAAPAK